MDLRTDLPSGVQLLPLDALTLDHLWETIRDKELLFPDFACSQASFYRAAVGSIILTAGPAYLRISNIVPLLRAEIHGFVLNGPLSPHRKLFQECLGWVFRYYGVKRVECFIPAKARSLRRFLTACGLTFEGRLHNRRSYRGELCPEDVYSILSEEYDERR